MRNRKYNLPMNYYSESECWQALTLLGYGLRQGTSKWSQNFLPMKKRVPRISEPTVNDSLLTNKIHSKSPVRATPPKTNKSLSQTECKHNYILLSLN